MQDEINQMETLPISAQLLSRYLNGTALESERMQIDELLQKDEMLKDSIDGLKLMNNPMILLQVAEELNSQIRVQSGFLLPKNTLFHLSKVLLKPVLAIAASLIVVAGSFLLFQKYGNLEKQLAVVKNTEADIHSATEEFEKSTLYSDSDAPLNVDLKNTELNEEAILNQKYINQLDSTELNIDMQSPVLNYGTTTSPVATGNMMNPMKKLAPPGLTSGRIENSDEESDDILSNNNKNIELSLKGQIIDNQTNQPIKGASIIVDGKLEGTSNVNGFYDIPINGGKHNIAYEQSGYDNESQQVVLGGVSQKPINISLNRSALASNGLVSKYENVSDKAKDQSLESASVIAEKKEVSPSGNNESNDLKSGLNSYSAQNYAAAITSLNKTLTKDPNNKDALFYLAMSHYNTGNSNKAISYYSKTIANGGKYKEDALWYKAQILLKQKNNEAARALLEELKDTKYNQRSIRLLDSINK